MASLVTSLGASLTNTLTSLTNFATGGSTKLNMPDLPEPPKAVTPPKNFLSQSVVEQRQERIKALEGRATPKSNLLSGNLGDQSIQNNQKQLLGQ
jgi:hypothetical protein